MKLKYPAFRGRSTTVWETLLALRSRGQRKSPDGEICASLSGWRDFDSDFMYQLKGEGLALIKCIFVSTSTSAAFKEYFAFGPFVWEEQDQS